MGLFCDNCNPRSRYAAREYYGEDEDFMDGNDGAFSFTFYSRVLHVLQLGVSHVFELAFFCRCRPAVFG